MLPFETEEEAIEIANDTPYGLAAYVQSGDTDRINRVSRKLRAGVVNANGEGGDYDVPFGGYKQSGFGGRDNSLHAHDQYTQLKTIWIDLADDADEAVD